VCHNIDFAQTCGVKWSGVGGGMCWDFRVRWDSQGKISRLPPMPLDPAARLEFMLVLKAFKQKHLIMHTQ